MKSWNKVVISILGEGEEVEVFRSLSQMPLMNQSELTFVTLVRSIEYGYGLGEYNLIFPVADDREKIKSEKIKKLKSLVEKNLPSNFKAKINFDCLFDENPKEKLCSFLNEMKADVVVMVARKKRGLFESSFTQYVAKHTDADVMILKHHEKK
jgi:nucleotide-binding universal stress UspA family protein